MNLFQEVCPISSQPHLLIDGIDEYHFLFLQSYSHILCTFNRPILRKSHFYEFLFVYFVILPEFPHHLFQLLYCESSIICLLQILKTQITFLTSINRTKYLVNPSQCISRQFHMCLFLLLLFLFSHIKLISLVDGPILYQPLLNNFNLIFGDIWVIGLQEILEVDLPFVFDIKEMEKRSYLLFDKCFFLERLGELFGFNLTFIP